MTDFLEWFEAEAERLLDRYEESGELPPFGPGHRRKRGSGMQSRFGSRGSLRQGLRVKPDVDAPVTIRFVDPASLRKDAA